MDAIIFLAPISGFDQALLEDRTINRLEDSVLLWKAVCSSKLLANVDLILFLNKCDILEKKLRSGIQYVSFQIHSFVSHLLFYGPFFFFFLISITWRAFRLERSPMFPHVFASSQVPFWSQRSLLAFHLYTNQTGFGGATGRCTPSHTCLVFRPHVHDAFTAKIRLLHSPC